MPLHKVIFVVILCWFVDTKVLDAAINSDKLIEETEVESHPKKVPCSILDENVDISIVRQYFTNDAWLLVQDVIEMKKEMVDWFCNNCQLILFSLHNVL